MKKTINGIALEFDDVTTGDEFNEWSGICNYCIDKHNIPSRLVTDDGDGSGICGVKGCCNESDRYIDFE